MAASNFVTDFFKNVLVNLYPYLEETLLNCFSHKNLNYKKLQVQTTGPLCVPYRVLIVQLYLSNVVELMLHILKTFFFQIPLER